MGLSPKLGLDLLLKEDELKFDGDEDVAPVGGVRVVHASNQVRVCPDYIMQRLAHLALQDLGVIRNVSPNAFKKRRTATPISTSLWSFQDHSGFGFNQFRHTGLQAVPWQDEIPFTLSRRVLNHRAGRGHKAPGTSVTR